MNPERRKQDLLFLLDELQHALSQKINNVLQRKYQISYSEWKLLLSVFIAQQSPSQEQIGLLARKTPAAVSRQLKLLEDRDLVERKSSQSSSRIKHVKLTKSGSSLINRSLLEVTKFSHTAFGQLPRSDQAVLKDNLITLLEFLEDND